VNDAEDDGKNSKPLCSRGANSLRWTNMETRKIK